MFRSPRIWEWLRACSKIAHSLSGEYFQQRLRTMALDLNSRSCPIPRAVWFPSHRQITNPPGLGFALSKMGHYELSWGNYVHPELRCLAHDEWVTEIQEGIWTPTSKCPCSQAFTLASNSGQGPLPRSQWCFCSVMGTFVSLKVMNDRKVSSLERELGRRGGETAYPSELFGRNCFLIHEFFAGLKIRECDYFNNWN